MLKRQQLLRPRCRARWARHAHHTPSTRLFADALQGVVDLLRVPQVLALGTTCRTLHAELGENAFWKRRFLADFHMPTARHSELHRSSSSSHSLPGVGPARRGTARAGVGLKTGIGSSLRRLFRGAPTEGPDRAESGRLLQPGAGRGGQASGSSVPSPLRRSNSDKAVQEARSRNRSLRQGGSIRDGLGGSEAGWYPPGHWRRQYQQRAASRAALIARRTGAQADYHAAVGTLQSMPLLRGLVTAFQWWLGGLAPACLMLWFLVLLAEKWNKLPAYRQAAAQFNATSGTGADGGSAMLQPGPSFLSYSDVFLPLYLTVVAIAASHVLVLGVALVGRAQRPDEAMPGACHGFADQEIHHPWGYFSKGLFDNAYILNSPADQRGDMPEGCCRDADTNPCHLATLTLGFYAAGWACLAVFPSLWEVKLTSLAGPPEPAVSAPTWFAIFACIMVGVGCWMLAVMLGGMTDDPQFRFDLPGECGACTLFTQGGGVCLSAVVGGSGFQNEGEGVGSPAVGLSGLWVAAGVGLFTTPWMYAVPGTRWPMVYFHFCSIAFATSLTVVSMPSNLDSGLWHEAFAPMYVLLGTIALASAVCSVKAFLRSQSAHREAVEAKIEAIRGILFREQGAV